MPLHRAPAPDAPVAFGIVSPGRWGRKLLDAARVSPHLRFGGVFSRQADNAAAIVRDYGGQVYPSFPDLLAAPAVEAVLLPTPHFLHHAQTLAALAAGKHVFVEKPIATTLVEAEAMDTAARAAGRVLAVGQQCRHTGAARRVRALLTSGEFGRLASVVVVQGFPLLLGADATNWRIHAENLPGGPLDEFGVHYFDVLRYWCGPVRRVRGVASRQLTASDVPDTVAAVLEFDAGVVATYSAHFVSVGLSRVTLYGTKGAMELNRFGDLPSFWQPATDMATARTGGAPPQPVTFDGPTLVATALTAELDDFARAIRSGGQPEVGAREGIAALRVARAVLESSRTGRAIDLEE